MGAAFHVLLEDPGVLTTRTGEVARVLAKALVQPVADVSQRVRYGGGIVAREVTEHQAKEISQKLSDAGITAFTLPSEKVAPLPRARRLAGIAIDAGGLRTWIRNKPPETWPWGQIRALHVTALARALSPAEVEEGRKARPIADVESAPDDVRRLTAEIDYWEDREKTKRIDLCLDLVANGPLVARLTADEADYSELEGKRPGALENFMLLVRALVKAAPGSVVVPPTTRAFAERAEWQAVLHEKPEQRDAWNLWLAVASENGKPFGKAATGGTGGAGSPPLDEELAEVEEIDDAEVQDDDEEDDEEGDEEGDEEDEDEDDEDSHEENVKAAGGDAELAKELALFDKTRKLRKQDVLDALEAAKKLDDEKALETDEVPPSNDPDMQIFKEKTGKWDVSKLMEETKELEDKDI